MLKLFKNHTTIHSTLNKVDDADSPYEGGKPVALLADVLMYSDEEIQKLKDEHDEESIPVEDIKRGVRICWYSGAPGHLNGCYTICDDWDAVMKMLAIVFENQEIAVETLNDFGE